MAQPAYLTRPHDFCPVCKSDSIRSPDVNKFAGAGSVIDFLSSHATGIIGSKIFGNLIDLHNQTIRQTGFAVNAKALLITLASVQTIDRLGSLKIGPFEIAESVRLLDLCRRYVDYKGTVAEFATWLIGSPTGIGRHCRDCAWREVPIAYAARPNGYWMEIDGADRRRRFICDVCNRPHLLASEWSGPDDLDIHNPRFNEREIRWRLFSKMRDKGIPAMIEESEIWSDWFEEIGKPDFKLFRGVDGRRIQWDTRSGFNPTATPEKHFSFRSVDSNHMNGATRPYGTLMIYASNAGRPHNREWMLGFPPGTLTVSHYGKGKFYGRCNLHDDGRGRVPMEHITADGFASFFDPDATTIADGTNPGLFAGQWADDAIDAVWRPGNPPRVSTGHLRSSL